MMIIVTGYQATLKIAGQDNGFFMSRDLTEVMSRSQMFLNAFSGSSVEIEPVTIIHDFLKKEGG